MLLLGSHTTNTPVMSLQTGAQVASFDTALINPDNLTIAAYTLKGPRIHTHPSFLRIADIRELGGLGAIINDTDDIIVLGDVIKIDELYELGFPLLGMSVVTQKGKRLGKIEDYVLETSSFSVQKLQVNRGFFKSLGESSLVIGRSQIVEITQKSIVVKDAEVRETPPVKQRVEAAYEYVNPFRKPTTQTDASDIL